MELSDLTAAGRSVDAVLSGTGSVSSVKRISLYLESRARPAEKHTSRIHSTKLWLGLQTTVSTQPSESKQLIINFNPKKYRILLIIKKFILYSMK